MKRVVESRDGNAFQSNAEGSRLRRQLQCVTANVLLASEGTWAPVRKSPKAADSGANTTL